MSLLVISLGGISVSIILGLLFATFLGKVDEMALASLRKRLQGDLNDVTCTVVDQARVKMGDQAFESDIMGIITRLHALAQDFEFKGHKDLSISVNQEIVRLRDKYLLNNI